MTFNWGNAIVSLAVTLTVYTVIGTIAYTVMEQYRLATFCFLGMVFFGALWGGVVCV